MERITILYILIFTSSLLVNGQRFNGGHVYGNTRLKLTDSPFRIEEDILVEQGATLTIDPGVELQFGPRVMLAVNGTLIAKGSRDQRILMTKTDDDRSAPVWPSDIRLVDERSVHLGRLQLLHQGKWRGVCANYVNWTQVDIDVACRQLGFERGVSHREYHNGFAFMAFAANESKYMSLYKPDCQGTEDSITQCPGYANAKIGSKICLNQLTVHLYCEGLSPSSPAVENWWGLEFYNSSFYLHRDGVLQSNESTSMLHYVDIEFAGVDKNYNSVPAIRASPYVPHLINVRLRHNALDGTNYTDVRTLTIIQGSEFKNNRGHGLGLETHIGRVSITNSQFSNNAGNGMKTKFLDGRFPIRDNRETFCQLALPTGPQLFPQLITGIPSDYGSSCDLRFRAMTGNIITLNVLEMEIENTADVWGTLTVYDGDHETDRMIATYNIKNGTLPQGITSTEHQLLVRFRYQTMWNCPILAQCVKFTILVDAGPSVVPELYMNNTVAENNLQHGIFLENVRNYAYVNSSTLSHNNYGAGLRVHGGAGDVHVNASRIDNNRDTGVNLTYAGGMRIFNRTSISYNLGNGLNVTLNETRIDNKTRYARHQRTEVFFSTISYNEGHGVRVGNFCARGLIAINDTQFHYNHGNAVDLTSCFQISSQSNVTNMTIAYNRFIGNYGHAIRLAPLLNVVGRIANNTFEYHERHTLLIDNTGDLDKEREFSPLRVTYEIEANTFRYNKGFYVVFARLTERSTIQRLHIRYNYFKHNLIAGSFEALNERSRAHAVVVLSSSNVNFTRNWMENKDSRYEIATQLNDKGVVLNVARQWWVVGMVDPLRPNSGEIEYENILPYLFDQHSRYNLAELSYHPVLKFPNLWTSTDTANDYQPVSPEFERGDSIGGRLNYEFRVEPYRTYQVDKDITVLPEGRFLVSPGAKLEFENGIGMLIQGYLDTQINNGQAKASFVLKNETTFVPYNDSLSVIHLVGGPNEFEGRVEVRPNVNDSWGTICNQDWDDVDASVVCKMLGLVIHPEDWRVYGGTGGSPSMPIWRSSVQCIDLDMDIMECKADDRMDHSCNHTQDVWVRCYEPTWAGIHFTATARPGRLAHSEVSEAGLLDPSAFLYSPAILIDYNVQTLSYLNVHHNLQTGILALHNDVYANAKVEYSEIHHNLGNGISTRTSFFEVAFCDLHHNVRAGVDYNPRKTIAENVQIRAGIVDAWVFEDLSESQAGSWSQVIVNEGYNFIITEAAVRENSAVRTYDIQLEVNSNHHLVLDILDYNPDLMQENLTVYDGRRDSSNEGTHRWVIEDDLVDFPVESASRYLHLVWTVRNLASGRLSFAVRSKPNSWRWPFATMLVRNSTMRANEHGVVSRHYNQLSDEYRQTYTRYRWEYITLHGLQILDSTAEAIHVPSLTKYHELYLPSYEALQDPGKVCEIRYEVEACRMTNNSGALLAEHNHVEFANNVWIWHITNNVIDRNRKGGFFLELPQVNLMYTELYNHSVEVNDTRFEYNQNFEFRLEGFYCNATIARNRFSNNECKKGCITIAGTEKDFDFYDNEIVDNKGKYIMELFMTRHTPYTRWVEASFSYNNFKRNSKLESDEDPPLASSPEYYTLGVRGLQNITINYNLFSNYMDYELLGGQDSSSLEIYLDVTLNYWGSVDQPMIHELIFDFHDWNSFAIAQYYPYLLDDAFDAPRSTEGQWTPELDPDAPLGGRIDGHLTLPTRSAPYIIKADLTVMPTGSLIIEEGTTLEFYPNVGILVLGVLTVNGKSYSHVRFRPVEPEHVTSRYGFEERAQRIKRQLAASGGRSARAMAGSGIGGGLHDSDRATGSDYEDPQIRLNGGETPDEGFVEFYNATENRWTITCDDSFNERTAEVICKSINKEWSNVIVRRTRYYDIFILGYPKMHDQVIEWFWRRSYICDGSEDDIDQCRYQVNYRLTQCMDEREYVYMKCGPRNLAENLQYWGNIRFSAPQYELGDIGSAQSTMKFVDIYGAGILHGEKAAAIQAIHRAPNTDYIRISHCNWNGYDYIAPRDEFLVQNNRIENVNGYGIGGLILNGESSEEEDLSSFIPLRESEIPYNTYGFVRMCSTEKLVYVRDRVLLYYKYRFDTIDCIKILRSREQGKQIVVRFLQVQLFKDDFYKNAIEMYNGEYFSPEMLLGEITPQSTTNDLRRPYLTKELADGYKYDTMGIRVTASPAYGNYGFIAEVATVPLSPGWKPILGPGLRQRIVDTSMTGNQHGAIKFSNVGEINPALIIERARIQDCGYGIYNLSSPPVMHLQVQNSRLLTIANNYIVGNRGGIHVNSTTNSIATAIWSNITNNVIVFNTHGEMLHIEGHHYQGFWVRNNFIAHNQIDHRNVLSVWGVSGNVSLTNLVNNTAMTIVNSSLPEQVSIAQRYFDNGIYDNFAIGGNHTTVFCRSAKATFTNNYFYNTYNRYDLVTYNRTYYDNGVYPSMDARMNWWGQGRQSYVDGRIWHQDDDENLIKVDYMPFHEKNTSLIQGRCLPGWRLYEERCYYYLGGVAPYEEANKMCKRDYGTLARALDRDLEKFLGELVASQQENYDKYWRTWVWHEVRKDGLCSVLRDYKIEHIDCEILLPYICEKSPYVRPEIERRPVIVAISVTVAVLLIIAILALFTCFHKTSPYVIPEIEWRPVIIATSVTVAVVLIIAVLALFTCFHITSPYVSPEVEWRYVIIAISVTVAVLLIVAVIALFACVKSRQRSKERFERRASLRASLRGSKASMISARSQSRLPQDMQIQSRRRPPLAHSMDDHLFDLSGVTFGETSDGDMSSTVKSRLDSNRPATPHSFDDDDDISTIKNGGAYRYKDAGPVHRGSFDNLAYPAGGGAGGSGQAYGVPNNVENEIASVPARPVLPDTAYKNRGFDDAKSLDRSVLNIATGQAAYFKPSPQKPRPPLASDSSRQPLPSQRSLLDESIASGAFAQGSPAPSLPKDEDDGGFGAYKRPAAGARSKPRAPLHTGRPQLPSDLSDASSSQSFVRSVPELLNTSRASGGGRSKPRPPLNTARQRPPLHGDVVRGVGATGIGGIEPPVTWSQQPEPRQRARSRDTLNSSSSVGSLSDKPRPRETDM